jgi:LysM repeat protein
MRYVRNLRVFVSLAAITVIGCSNEPPANEAVAPEASNLSAERVETPVSIVDQAAEFHRLSAADERDVAQVDGVAVTNAQAMAANTATREEQVEHKQLQVKLPDEDSKQATTAAKKVVETKSLIDATVTLSEYTVQLGDTLRGIAKQHNTTVAALVSANDIDNPNVIYVGRALSIKL